jgi:hypothetical protein
MLPGRRIYQGSSVAGGTSAAAEYYSNISIELTPPGYRIEPFSSGDGRSGYRIPAEFVTSVLARSVSVSIALLGSSGLGYNYGKRMHIGFR